MMTIFKLNLSSLNDPTLTRQRKHQHIVTMPMAEKCFKLSIKSVNSPYTIKTYKCPSLPTCCTTFAASRTVADSICVVLPESIACLQISSQSTSSPGLPFLELAAKACSKLLCSNRLRLFSVAATIMLAVSVTDVHVSDREGSPKDCA